MANIVLHGLFISPFVRAAGLALHEKGVSYTLQGIKEFSDIKTPEYLKLHPFGRMPAFRHGETVLFESSAICRYVDTTFDGPPLMPEDVVEAARAEQWVSAIKHYLVENLIYHYVMQYVFPKGPDGTPDRAVIDGGKDNVRRDCGILDGALEGRAWLVGERPTIADFYLVSLFHMAKQMPDAEDFVGGFANLERFYAAFAERASYQATSFEFPPGIAIAAE